MLEINWADECKDPRELEDKLALLLQRLFPDAQHIDGSGGDGGRDVHLERGNSLTIFEIKAFPDRINKSRREQIRTSLISAARLQPDEWWLIAPLNLNPAEFRWLDDLREQFPFIAGHRGRTWINSQLVQHQELFVAYQSVHERILAEIRVYEQEHKLLLNIPDYAARLQQLVARGNALGGAMYELVPTRRADGAIGIEVRLARADAPPIFNELTIDFRSTAGADGADLENRFRSLIETGGEDAVEIPPGLVTSFRPSPEGARILGEGMPARDIGLWFKSVTEPVSIMGVLQLYGEGERSPSLRYGFELLKRRRGSQGATLLGRDAHDTVRFQTQWKEGGQPNFNITFVGGTGQMLPAAAIPAMRLGVALTTAERMQVSLNGHSLGPVQALPSRLPAEELDERRAVLKATEDLAYVQDRLAHYFPLPDAYTAADIVWLSRLHQLLESGSVDEWIRGTLSAAIELGHVSDVLEDLPDERFAIGFTEADLQVHVCGNDLTLGPVQIYSPDASLGNRAELAGDVETAPRSAEFVPATGWWSATRVETDRTS